MLHALMALSAYLAIQSFWIWGGRRSETGFLLIALWCVDSLLYQFCRHAQLTAETDQARHLADRGAFTSAVLVVMLLVMATPRLVTVAPWRRAERALIALTTLVLALNLTTDLFITARPVTYDDWLRGPTTFSQVGPLYTPTLLILSNLAYGYGLLILRQAPRFSRRQVIVFVAGITAYLATGLNDILLFEGWLETTTLFEYGFAAVSIGLTLVVVRRVELTQSRLADTVDARTAELRVALEEARAAEVTRRQFLDSVQHEMLTPLHGVIGMTQLLRDTELDPAQRRAVEAIEASGRRLEGLVIGVIDETSGAGEFDLRVVLDETAGPSWSWPEPPVTGGDPSKVLVVEDNAINQMVLTGMLNKLGLAAEVVEDGVSAIERVADGAYAIVFMDFNLPGVDGLEATREIRRRRPDGKPIIVATTAHILPLDRARGLAAGMDDYLAKPLRLETLIATLRRHGLLTDDVATVPPPEAPPAAASPPPPGPVLDEHVLIDLLAAGGVEFVEQLAGVLSDSLPARLTELRAAVARGDAAALLSVAHRLKGSAATIGAAELAAVARNVETSINAGALEEARVAVESLEPAAVRYRDALRGWSLANAAR